MNRWGSRVRSVSCSLGDNGWLESGLSEHRLAQMQRDRALLFLVVTADHRLLVVRWAAQPAQNTARPQSTAHPVHTTGTANTAPNGY